MLFLGSAYTHTHTCTYMYTVVTYIFTTFRLSGDGNNAGIHKCILKTQVSPRSSFSLLRQKCCVILKMLESDGAWEGPQERGSSCGGLLSLWAPCLPFTPLLGWFRGRMTCPSLWHRDKFRERF